MKASIRVHRLDKHYVMTEAKQGSISLLQALRHGKRETVSRKIEALSDVSFEISRGRARRGDRAQRRRQDHAALHPRRRRRANLRRPVEIEGEVHAMLTIGAVLRDQATGRENIYLDGAVHGKSREEIERRAQDIIDFAEIGEFIDRPVHTYSSGMKGRLSFAMGAFIEPDILILDETLAAGDVFYAEKAIGA